MDCRLRNAGQLGVFTALYADTVVIPNPFFVFANEDYSFKNERDKYFFYNLLIGTIKLMLYYKPLIKDGFIRLNATTLHLCADCYKKSVEERKKIGERYDPAANKLEKKLLREMKFELRKDASISIVDDEKYTNFEIFTYDNPPKNLKKYIEKAPYVFTSKEAKELQLVKNIVSSSVQELVFQKWSWRVNNLTYLTNNRVDSEIIEETNENKKANRALVEGLSHSLPFLTGVDLKKLIKLRKSEQAFLVYRAAMKKLLAQVKNETSEKSIQEAVNDIVAPEIARIEQVVKKNREFFEKDATNKLIFNSIVATAGMIGLFFHIPAALIQAPSIFAGTVKSAETFKDIMDSVKEPKEIATNDYYFLWKLKKTVN